MHHKIVAKGGLAIVFSRQGQTLELKQNGWGSMPGLPVMYHCFPAQLRISNEGEEGSEGIFLPSLPHSFHPIPLSRKRDASWSDEVRATTVSAPKGDEEEGSYLHPSLRSSGAKPGLSNLSSLRGLMVQLHCNDLREFYPKLYPKRAFNKNSLTASLKHSFMTENVWCHNPRFADCATVHMQGEGELPRQS